MFIFLKPNFYLNTLQNKLKRICTLLNELQGCPKVKSLERIKSNYKKNLRLAVVMYDCLKQKSYQEWKKKRRHIMTNPVTCYWDSYRSLIATRRRQISPKQNYWDKAIWAGQHSICWSTLVLPYVPSPLNGSIS